MLSFSLCLRQRHCMVVCVCVVASGGHVVCTGPALSHSRHHVARAVHGLLWLMHCTEYGSLG